MHGRLFALHNLFPLCIDDRPEPTMVTTTYMLAWLVQQQSHRLGNDFSILLFLHDLHAQYFNGALPASMQCITFKPLILPFINN
jgi:hypothetical protein